MELTLNMFFNQIINSPTYLIIILLTLGVILVNGWTDAPNAIANCVATRTLSPKKSIFLAAIFNFLGVTISSIINKSVAQTIYNIANFDGANQNALIALCAGLFAIVVWAVLAWLFGIPTSESHALIAGISGASVALHGNFSGINGGEWIKVVYGLIISLILGFTLGYLFTKIIEKICIRINKNKTSKFFTKGQILGASLMAFMHGAQDGQKFIGVFLLGTFLASGTYNVTEFQIPIWLMILCSLVMTIGTSIGGYKIIKTVGMKMVKLKRYQGFASDIAGFSCLAVSSIFGIPVSTTHTKTTAIMGVGASKGITNVNWKIVKDMMVAWILTFPGCGILGYVSALIFMKIF